MASPVVAGTAETAVSTAGTNHAITLPGSIAAGDLLIVCLNKGSTAATVNALTGWTELLDENVAGGLFIAWKKAVGGDSNPTFVTSASTRSATIALRITGAADPTVTPPAVGTTATASSNTPDPPSVTPPSSKDYLFIALYGRGLEEADDDTWSNTPPTNYTPNPPLQIACGTAGTNLGGLIALAHRQLTTGSAENPGTFGDDVATTWRAQTIIVHPSSAVSVDAAAKGSDFVGPSPVVDRAVDASAKASDFVGPSPEIERSLDASAKASDFVAGLPRVSYKDEVFLDGPVIYLRLNEPSGSTANDETANNNDGTYQNSPTLGVTGAIQTDAIGTAVTFDATDDYISVADHSSLDLGDTLSLEFWVKTTQGGGGPYYILTKGIDSYGVRMRFGAICFEKSNVADIVESTVAVNDGSWHHVVCTKSGSTVKIYIDGVDRTGSVTNQTLGDTSSELRIGATFWTTSSQLWDGSLDEVAIYSTALSQSRVQAHYNAALVASTVDVNALAKDTDFVGPAPELERSLDAAGKTSDFVGPAPEIERSLDALAKDTDFVGPAPEIERSLDATGKASDFVGPAPEIERSLDASGKASDFVGPAPEIERSLDAAAKASDFVGPAPELERSLDAFSHVSFSAGLPTIDQGAIEILAVAKDSDFTAGIPELERSLDSLGKGSDFTSGLASFSLTVNALGKASDEQFGFPSSIFTDAPGILLTSAALTFYPELGPLVDEGLYPSDSLFPSESLFPDADDYAVSPTPLSFDLTHSQWYGDLSPDQPFHGTLNSFPYLGELVDAGLYPDPSLFPDPGLFPDADDYAVTPDPLGFDLSEGWLVSAELMQ